MKRAVAAFVFLLGALVALSTAGLVVSTDSVGYVTMARSLLSSGTLQSWDGGPQGWWPPGYAGLLALLDPPLGSLPLRLALLHALLWGGCAALVLAAGRRLPSAVALTLATGFFASTVSVRVFGSALSEALFLPLLAGFLLVLDRWRRSGSDRDLLALASLLALLPLTRTLGVAAFLVFGLGALRIRDRVPMIRSLGAGAAAMLPLLAWLLRNLYLFGEPAPGFPGSPRPLGDTLRRSSEVTLRWWIPQVDSTDVLRVSGVVVLIALVMLARPTGRPMGRWLRELARRAADSAPLQLGVLLLALLLYGSATRLVDRPDDRILAPLFLCGVFLLVEIAEGRRLRFGRRAAGAWLLGAWALWSVGGGVAAWSHPAPEGRPGQSLRASSAIADSIVASVAAYRGPDPVVTNIPARVHWLTGRRATWDPLLRGRDASKESAEAVYLEGMGRAYLLDREELAARGLRPLPTPRAPLLLRRAEGSIP